MNWPPLNISLLHWLGPKAVLPIDGPWRNVSLKAFLKNVDAGKEESGKTNESQNFTKWHLIYYIQCFNTVVYLFQGCDVDCQMDGVTKLAPVVAMFAGRPKMLEKVESAIRVTQSNDMCVAVTLAAARWGGSGDDVFRFCLKQREILNLVMSVCEIRFLEHYIVKGPDPGALDAVLAQLNDPNRKSPQELDRAVICKVFLLFLALML